MLLQDVSGLVDLCRQCIVFEDLKDIAACMMVIKEDPEVRVLRVKNRHDLRHRPAITAGYRDVGINLQITCPETRDAGIDNHVCELQLIYKPFAELKVAPPALPRRGIPPRPSAARADAAGFRSRRLKPERAGAGPLRESAMA